MAIFTAIGTAIIAGGAAASAFWAGLSAVITAASTIYQITQAKKARAKARAAAEARKGFETVTETEVVSLPIIYGRAKVGGVRVWAQTASTLNDMLPTIQDVDTIGNGLNGTQTGSKNEYLLIQQAICLGPIHKFYDFVIDGNYHYNDSNYKHIHAECHGNGGINSNVTKNFAERSSALFTGVAYSNIFTKIDRDNPAEIPNVSFFIEGRKVRSITRSGSVNNYSYAINSSRTYSNNPALCLLDYLLEDTSSFVLNTSTKALDISEIDLESFYNASLVCDRIVQQNVLVGGKIWRPTNEIRNVSRRNIPLYECNIILDTSKPIRENIESILSTMGDARLIWSNGKYKLSLQYPGAN